MTFQNWRKMRREIIISKNYDGLPDISTINDTISLWLQTIPKGEWSLRLEKIKKKRSLNQNALLWAWMTAVAKEWADATGDYFTKEQFKETFARRFIPVTGPDGETVGRSTSTLTKEEMTEFLTNIHVWVSENMHINLPNAEDRMFNEWYSQYEDD